MTEIMKKVFPHSNIKNIAMFYILSGVYSAWIIAGVWVFIWGAFMTKTQIGISDTITFTIGFLVELPSGVFADLIGRRKAILIGNTLLTIGNLFVALSSSFWSITGWYLVWTVGYAFNSGATEALAYDSLKKEGLAEKWKEVISTSVIIGRTSSLISTALGGYLFSVGLRLPYLVTALISVIGVLAVLNMKEIPVSVKIQKWSLNEYLLQIKDGVHVLFRKKIFPISLIAIGIMSIAYLYNWGLLRPLTAERFGFSATGYSMLLSLTSLIGIVAVWLLSGLKSKIDTTRYIFIVGLAYSSIFILMGLPHKMFIGGAIQITLAILLMYMDILFSEYINKHTSESHRATTLSAVTLFTKLPYVFLALIIGKIADNHSLPAFTLIIGFTALLLWIISKTLTLRVNRIKDVD